jgi:hypothetical protein
MHGKTCDVECGARTVKYRSTQPMKPGQTSLEGIGKRKVGKKNRTLFCAFVTGQGKTGLLTVRRIQGVWGWCANLWRVSNGADYRRENGPCVKSGGWCAKKIFS